MCVGLHGKNKRMKHRLFYLPGLHLHNIHKFISCAVNSAERRTYKNMKRKRVLSVSIVLVLLFSMVLSAATPVSSSSVDEWKIASDTELFWVNTSDSNVQDSSLAEQIQLFDSELAASGICQEALPITYGELADAGTNDIILILDTTKGITKQGYEVSVGTGITITASDRDGLFYGCRYVLQSLMLKSGLAIGHTITDAPDVMERALNFDMGRKYYTKDWIINLIKEMSWSNMNTLILHFSEDMGCRLESKQYPWLAGSDASLCIESGITDEDEGLYITQDEMREIAEAAKLYHVELIPAFDSPGHMNYIVKKYNEYYNTDIGNYFHYNGKTSIVQGSGDATAKKYSRGIDISNEEAVAFTKNLITEYAQFFKELGCTKFDIGGDELLGWGTAVVSTSIASRWQQLDHWKAYAIERTGNSNAVAYDAFILYMNDLYDLLSELGYSSVRMWNDDAYRTYDTGWSASGGAAQLNPAIEISYWSNSANNSGNTVFTYLSKGHTVYNYLNTYNYYVLKDGVTYSGANPQSIYTEWNPFFFESSTVTGSQAEKVAGSAFCIWCDNPSYKTRSEILEEVIPLLRANGTKAWDCDINDSVSYSAFSQKVNVLGNAPADLTEAPEIYVIPDVTLLRAAIEEFNEMDPALYTEESFRTYQAAVEAAKELLSGKPNQTEVDSALDVIAAAKTALVPVAAIDLSALQAVVEAYYNLDASQYTSESFGSYRNIIIRAEELMNSASVTQEQVDDMLAAASLGLEQLRPADQIGDINCITMAKFSLLKVVSGRTVSFAVTTNQDVAGFEIYDDMGNRINADMIASAANAANPTKKVYGFKITITEVGLRTFTVYAIDRDGMRSADSYQTSIHCIN